MCNNICTLCMVQEQVVAFPTMVGAMQDELAWQHQVTQACDLIGATQSPTGGSLQCSSTMWLVWAWVLRVVERRPFYALGFDQQW
jgi:hypothetical protein